MAKKKSAGRTKSSGKGRRTSKETRTETRQRHNRQLQLLLVMTFVVLLIVIVAGDGLLLDGGDDAAPQVITDPNAPMADFYTREVLYWEDEIRTWAERYQINPNVIAILIQIESCGSPEVLSWVGAVGLMQVMPYYFDNGENMLNPDTNVRHGMFIFDECLNVFADGQIGVAAACYNGGASVTQTTYANWPNETQHYYDWVNGLWQDVVAGADSSDTLDEWLQAGGAGLCETAAKHLLPSVVVAPTLAVGVLGAP